MTAARMSFEDCAKEAWLAHERASLQPLRRVAGRRSADFKATEFSRLTYDWSATRTPADESIRWALPYLRARARDLARNNSYVRQYLNLLRMNVIGPEGVRLQSQVRNNDGQLNKLINDRIESAWAEWAHRPTVDGRQDLGEFSQVSLETFAKEGEALIRIHRGFDNPFGFALEAIDPDQLDEAANRPPGRDGPEIRMGVEIDSYTRPLAYYVWNAPVGMSGALREADRERIPADEILHLYRMDRPNQTRGVTSLAPVMFALRMLDGYDEAELVGARVGASATGVFTPNGDGPSPPSDEQGEIQIEANPGTFIIGPKGYDLQSWDPNRPNGNYASFVKACLRKIASGLSVSYNVMANDLEGVNYSSMRSGMLTERDLWRTLQQWWISSFLRPVFDDWLGMSLLSGGLVLDSRAPAKYRACRWIPRGWPWVDPLKDTEAGIAEIQTGLGSRTDLLAAQGKDLEEVLEQLAAEKKLAATYGVDISGPKGAEQSKAAKEGKEAEATDARGVSRLAPYLNGVT